MASTPQIAGSSLMPELVERQEGVDQVVVEEVHQRPRVPEAQIDGIPQHEDLVALHPPVSEPVESKADGEERQTREDDDGRPPLPSARGAAGPGTASRAPFTSARSSSSTHDVPRIGEWPPATAAVERAQRTARFGQMSEGSRQPVRALLAGGRSGGPVAGGTVAYHPPRRRRTTGMVLSMMSRSSRRLWRRMYSRS